MTEEVSESKEEVKKPAGKPLNHKKPPTFIGISIEHDFEFREKLAQIVENCERISGIKMDLIKEAVYQKEVTAGTWSKPSSWHVTALFIGGFKEQKKKKKRGDDEANLMQVPEFMEFREGVNEPVRICGVIYVEDFLFTGVCFPTGVKIKNQCPHLTIAVNEGKPMESN